MINRLPLSLSLGLIGLMGYACTVTDKSSDPKASVAGGGSGGNPAHQGGMSGSIEPNAEAGAAGASEGGALGAGSAGASGESGAGGSAGCGALGEACCGSSCHGGLSCLGAGAGAVCSCASSLHSEYVIRTDGAVLAETETSQIAIVDATTSAPLAPVENIQDGQDHGCASLSDSHTAWCWRWRSTGNAQGQLGDGTTDTGPLFLATKVLKGANQPLTDVALVATGVSNTACAVLTDSTAYCWGDLAQVINGGATLNSGYAVRVTLDGTTPLTGVKQLVLGLAHACALVEGSTADEVWCWGYDRGNLGLGTATGNGNSQYPKKIVGLTHPTQLAIANGGPLYSTTCAVDGENVRCWGSNNNQGSVGVPSSTGTFVSPPALVTTSATGAGVLDGVVKLQSGTLGNAADFCVLRTDDSAWCWGSGYTPYAKPQIATHLVDLGWSGDPRFLTSDGLYHLGATTRALNCGKL